MKTLITSIAISLFLALAINSGIASANPQHQKMKACSGEAKAKNLKGQERKDFMKTCLSTDQLPEEKKDEAKTMTPQQEKMKKCNADAREKSLKGPDRKSFMKSCLSA